MKTECIKIEMNYGYLLLEKIAETLKGMDSNKEVIQVLVSRDDKSALIIYKVVE